MNTSTCSCRPDVLAVHGTTGRQAGARNCEAQIARLSSASINGITDPEMCSRRSHLLVYLEGGKITVRFGVVTVH